MESPAELLAHCHVNTNNDGDRFVGIKADSDNAMVYFPLGYQLPQSDTELRQDILHLISVLAEFTNNNERVLAMPNFEVPQSVDFPINAYMDIINNFMEQGGYYTEREPEYRSGDNGPIAWTRTFRQKRPLIQSCGSPVYTEFIVRHVSPNDQNFITQIHKYCVYESFYKLGWLFTPYLPEQPTIPRNDKMFISILREKLANIYNDKDKRLFLSMIAMLEYVDEKTNEKQFYYGTDRFEYIWERLVDRVFGIKNKIDYFPRTRWTLHGGRGRTNAALEPDTIMLRDGNVFILDAKYYKFGLTGALSDLPESSSINKQITYGEFIHTQRYNGRAATDVPVYNAFVMPYNPMQNRIGTAGTFINIGEATGEWKSFGYKYERVQGILVDIRYLMYHYTGKTSNQILQLAQSIERAFAIAGGVLPT